MGQQPGLEVWDRQYQQFYALEESYEDIPGVCSLRPCTNFSSLFNAAASVLVGHQLNQLSNQRYALGGHRVVSIPRPDAPSRYRYSLVFILRMHSPVPVDSDLLTTNLTGKFAKPIKMKAGDLFQQISSRHFNVNVPKSERDAQRAKTLAAQLEAKAKLTDSNAKDGVDPPAELDASG